MSLRVMTKEEVNTAVYNHYVRGFTPSESMRTCGYATRYPDEDDVTLSKKFKTMMSSRRAKAARKRLDSLTEAYSSVSKEQLIVYLKGVLNNDNENTRDRLKAAEDISRIMGFYEDTSSNHDMDSHKSEADKAWEMVTQKKMGVIDNSSKEEVKDAV